MTRVDTLMHWLAVGLLAGCAESTPPAASPTATGATPAPTVTAPPAPAPVDEPASTAKTEPASSPPPAQKPLLDLEASGCFAWSATEKRVACVQGLSSIQKGCHDALVLFGEGPTKRLRIREVPPQCLDAPPAKLEDAARTDIESQLAKSYARLPEVRHELEPGGKFETGSGSISFRRAVKKSVSVPNAGGPWNVYADEIHVACGAKKQKIFAVTVENALEPRVSIVDTGSPWLVLWYSASWGIEGDQGSRVDVALVERSSCVVKRP